MASEVMLAPTPATSIWEMDDVRDMVRNATVTTIYVSRSSCISHDILCPTIDIQNIIRFLPIYIFRTKNVLFNLTNEITYMDMYCIKIYIAFGDEKPYFLEVIRNMKLRRRKVLEHCTMYNFFSKFIVRI